MRTTAAVAAAKPGTTIRPTVIGSIVWVVRWWWEHWQRFGTAAGTGMVMAREDAQCC